MGSRSHTHAPTPQPWRATLRRHVAVLLAVKLAALALLWALCFSPAHRTPADGQATGRHLGVAPQEGTHD